MSAVVPRCQHNCAPFSVALALSQSLPSCTQILFHSLLFQFASDLATQLPQSFFFFFFTDVDYAIKILYYLTGVWLT